MNEQALDYKMQGFAMMGVEKFDKAVELFSKSIEIEQNSDVSGIAVTTIQKNILLVMDILKSQVY